VVDMDLAPPERTVVPSWTGACWRSRAGSAGRAWSESRGCCPGSRRRPG